MPQAVLGDEVKVDTLDGEKLLKIPPSTQYGKILTLKYHGVPFIGSNNKRGDHFVQVIIKTPSQITEEEKKLYTKNFKVIDNTEIRLYDYLENSSKVNKVLIQNDIDIISLYETGITLEDYFKSVIKEEK